MIEYSDEKNPYLITPGEEEWLGHDGVRHVNDLHDAYKQGYEQALKDVGWKRNCAETPVLTDDRLVINVRVEKTTGIARYHKRTGMFYVSTIDVVSNPWFYPEEITHWFEIPEIEG